MGYRIEGDGTRYRTNIWKDGSPVSNWNKCVISACKYGSIADVYFENEGKAVGVMSETLDRVVLTGVYLLIGDGKFENTKLIVGEDLFRGIQSVTVTIEKGKDPIIDIKAIFLPNLVEGEE